MDIEKITETFENTPHITQKFDSVSVGAFYNFSSGKYFFGCHAPRLVDKKITTPTDEIIHDKKIQVALERYIVLEENKLVFLSPNDREVIFKNAPQHMDEIKEFFYLVKLLRINVFGFSYFLEKKYPDKKMYPIQIQTKYREGGASFSHGWSAFENVEFYENKFIHCHGGCPTRPIIGRYNSPFDLRFPFGEAINGFISSDNIKLHEIQGDVHIIIYSQDLEVIFMRISEGENKKEAVENLSTMLKNIDMYNSILESLEDPNDSYYYYISQTIPLGTGNKSARSNKTGL